MSITANLKTGLVFVGVAVGTPFSFASWPRKVFPEQQFYYSIFWFVLSTKKIVIIFKHALKMLLNWPLWPSGLERQSQIQVDSHSKTQVRIPLENMVPVIWLLMHPL